MSDLNNLSLNLSLIHPEDLLQTEIHETEQIQETMLKNETSSELGVKKNKEKTVIYNNYTEVNNYNENLLKIFLENLKINSKKINKGNGKMDYIHDEQSRKMLENAWQAINLTETWDFVAQPIESFMWSQNPEIDIISQKMSELGYHGHSGCSFGWTMRQMQFLAEKGEDEFKKSFIKREEILPTPPLPFPFPNIKYYDVFHDESDNVHNESHETHETESRGSRGRVLSRWIVLDKNCPIYY